MAKNVLITGGAGFAGGHLHAEIIEKTNWNIVVLDALTYAGDLSRIESHTNHNKCKKNDRYKFIKYDVSIPFENQIIDEIGPIDYIFHLAAETFVDRSIHDPSVFMYSNFIGTFNLLEYARKLESLSKIICVSTDEVYGSAPQDIYYTEECRLKPSNPYSATKAGADCLALAWYNTYNLPIIITRSMNLFGPKQHPEKFIGSLLRSLIKGEAAIIHGTPENVGVRGWLHARNHAAALLFLVQNGISGEIYNIIGEEIDNISLAELIAKYANLNLQMRFINFDISRPGHDNRYALEGRKLKGMGFEYPLSFKHSLKETVKWYMENKHWLDRDIFISTSEMETICK